MKLSQDPNNTTWSKDTANYGHRILAQKGWSPGEYLGAENASHADHYSTANASHIRVLLREDNLGLGAKLGGKANADSFGLSTLSGIFGRLNGKSEDVIQKQQGALRDAELQTYQAQKYGFMNFVSGGLLVGDKMDETLVSTKVAPEVAKVEKETRPSKKREAEVDEVASKQSKSKKRRSNRDANAVKEISVDTTTQSQDEQAVQGEFPPTTSIAEKPSKKKRRETRHGDIAENDEVSEKAQIKQEKRERKEERRKRRAAKLSHLEPKPKPTDAGPTALEITTPASDSDSEEAAPPPRPSFAGNRHAVRQRYIQQKRLASMDPQALREILMIKAQ